MTACLHSETKLERGWLTAAASPGMFRRAQLFQLSTKVRSRLDRDAGVIGLGHRGDENSRRRNGDAPGGCPELPSRHTSRNVAAAQLFLAGQAGRVGRVGRVVGWFE